MNRDDCRTRWGSQFRSNEKSRPGMVERSGKKETKDCGEVRNDEKQTERLKRGYRWMRELRYQKSKRGKR